MNDFPIKVVFRGTGTVTPPAPKPEAPESAPEPVTEKDG